MNKQTGIRLKRIGDASNYILSVVGQAAIALAPNHHDLLIAMLEELQGVDELDEILRIVRQYVVFN